MHKLTAFLLRHEYLIWIICLCAILRLPSLLEPYWYGDEGIYLVLGNAIRRGLTLYRDIHDNKPPLLYFLAAASGSVFWFRFILLVWNSFAIIVFERLARIVFEETAANGTVTILGVTFPIPRWSTLATLLFALLPFFAEGAIANGEIFMIGPVLIGMYILWRQLTHGTWTMGSFALSGFFFSIAFLIKVPSLFDAFAAGFFFFLVIPFLAWRTDRKKFSLSRYLVPLIAFLMAFVLPIAFSFGYYSTKGVGKQYVAAAFSQNIGYLSSWATGTHATGNVGSSGLKYRAVAFGIGLAVLTILAKKNGKQTTFVVIWFAATLFGALLAERPYPHYLIQLIPPASLLIVALLQHLLQKSKRLSVVPIATYTAAIIIVVISIWSIRFWYYPLIPYYRNYISFITGQTSRDEYFAHFDASLPAMYALSEQVRLQTEKSERIFVWGDYPMIYALTRRLPPGRYTSSYHIKDFGGTAETIAAIEATAPRFIVIDTAYEEPFPALSLILSQEYVRMSTYNRFHLYRRFEL